MALASLPLNILESIVDHLVVAYDDHDPPSTTTVPGPDEAYLYTPPRDSSLPPCLLVGIARLPPFLTVCKAIYEALSPGYAVSTSNGDAYPLRTEVYARLCVRFLDVRAAGRRWRYPKRRKASGEEDTWDRDVEGVTNEGLTAHFVQTVRTLRFFKRAAKSIGIPLPFVSSHEPRRRHAGLASLYDESIEQILLTALVLMLEDDGKNHHQLRLVSAPQFVDMLVFHRLNEATGTPASTLGMPNGTHVKFNDGWPVENVLNTAAVWCVWLFTTEEKVQSETLPVREAMIRLVLPFVLCPYRYASALVPPTHYTLPLPTFAEGVYQRPLSTHTAHGQFPVYHSFPRNAVPPPPAIVPSHSRTPTPPTPAPPHPAAHHPPQPTPARNHVENRDANTAVPTNLTPPDAPPPPTLTDRQGGAGGGGPSNGGPTPDHNETGANADQDDNAGAASSSAQAPDAAADARTHGPPNQAPVPNHHAAPTPAGNAIAGPAAPAPPANANPNAMPATFTPRSSPTPPTPPRTIHDSRRPPASASNSQAHPSFGVSVPWYCSPRNENGVHQHLHVSGPSYVPLQASAPFRVTPGPLSSPNLVHIFAPPASTSSTYPSPTPERYITTNTAHAHALQGITLQLPLISAAAKLVFMSRREAVPLPVMKTLPVNRAAARAAGWRWAGPTQEDLREMGGWCSWGRREVWPRVVREEGDAAAEGQAADEGVAGEEGSTAEAGTSEVVAATPTPAPAKVEDNPMWYTDSQRWDIDWWRMRLCTGSEWQNSASPMFKQPHETLAHRMGRVYERGMLTGLWQGYMHMPNEASLDYVASTRQYPSNFGEAALGVMMRPVLVRLAEHAWVPRPGDPGPFVFAAGRPTSDMMAKGYWEKGIVGEWDRRPDMDEEEGGEGYECSQPKGGGPVPVARPTTMKKQFVVPPNGKALASESALGVSRAGFLDENMNNAWFPGPIGSLRWDAGSVVPTSATDPQPRHANAEEGVEDGVWRDKYVSQQDEEEERRLKMKGVTFCVPATFHKGEGIEVPQNPPAQPAPVPAAAAPVQGGVVAVPALGFAPMAVATNVALAMASAGGGPRVVTRLDNPNLPYPAPNPDDPSSSAAEQTQRTIVPPSRHVYETYDPTGVRESVHERMERAKGEACRGLRRHRESGKVTTYVYPHPGCLKCREREGALRRKRAVDVRERRMRRERREVRRVVGTEEVQEMFRSVGLGMGEMEEALEDEDVEMRVEEFGMDVEDVGESEGEVEDEEGGWETEDEIEVDEDEDGGRGDPCGCGICTGVDDGRAGGKIFEDEFEEDDAFSDFSDDDDELDSTILSSSFPACTSSSSSADVIITGSMDERHSEAWGNFAYYGRVRPWDGLVGILRIGTRDENVGNRFFFYGYVYGGRNFVGNWRYAVTDAVSAGMESSFVLTRRGDA